MDKNMNKVIESLENNGFSVRIFNNSIDAKKSLLEDISQDKSIGIGGSMTIFDMNLYEELLKRGNKVYWHWKVSKEKADEERTLAGNADIYLTSTNAITMDGKLINIDGTGNRVSSMFFGHEKVYIIAGKNKICKDYDDAMKRIKNTACPKNAKRLGVSTPCSITGKCNDCDSPDRICNVEVIIHKKPNPIDIYIYLINEDLGY